MNPATLTFGEVRHCFAAVLASNPYEAQSIIMNAHTGQKPNSLIFCEARSDNWEPWTERFPRQDGFEWPDPS